MSVALNLLGPIQNPKSVRLTTTAETDIVAPTGQIVVCGVSVANEDTSNAVRLTLRWSDGTNTYRFYEGSIAAGTSLDIAMAMPMLLNGGASAGNAVAKKITAQAASVDDLTVTAVFVGSLVQK